MTAGMGTERHFGAGNQGADVPCPNCRHIEDLPPDLTEWVCPACFSPYRFRCCSGCGGVSQVAARERNVFCSWCGRAFLFAKRRGIATAAEVTADLVARGLNVEVTEPDSRSLAGCTVVGGYGHGLSAGTHTNAVFRRDRIDIAGYYEGDRIEIFYEDVTAFEVGGRGEMRSGGGFMGGGFGVEGAAEGMIVASVLNALTSRTQIETIVSVRSPEVGIVLFWNEMTPMDLTTFLAPVFGRVEASQRPQAPVPQAASDIASQLSSLAALHQQGALDDQEFQAAKRRVLGQG
jgi:hypothetical protein